MDDKYFWTRDSGVSIDDFLKRTRPSLVTDDETPWIWVKGTTSTKEDPERITKHSETLLAARALLEKLQETLEGIQNDNSIPVRGKKGVKSKKVVREEELDKATEGLKDLSVKSGWTVGKWLFFPRGSEVDGIWGTLARSVVNGPLNKAGVDLIKVASAPKSFSEEQVSMHPICLYMDNVYDKELVTKILQVLLKEHGLEPSACKSDLYTLAGIDSKHPTALRSSLWRPSELIEGGGAAIKQIKDEHRARKTERSEGPGPAKTGRVRADGIIDSDSEDEKVVQAAKRKTPTQAEVKADDGEKEDVVIYKSEPAKSDQPGKRGAPPPTKRVKTAAMRYQEEDVFGGGSDSD